MAINPNDIPKIERYINPRRIPIKESIRIYSTDPRNNPRFLAKHPNTIIIDAPGYVSPTISYIEVQPDNNQVPENINSVYPEIYAVAAFEEENSNGHITISVYLNVSDNDFAKDFKAVGGQIA